jgi:hypothetical protein
MALPINTAAATIAVELMTWNGLIADSTITITFHEAGAKLSF